MSNDVEREYFEAWVDATALDRLRAERHTRRSLTLDSARQERGRLRQDALARGDTITASGINRIHVTPLSSEDV